MADRVPPFKVYGLQRSGTNITAYAISHYFVAFQCTRGYGWKHGLVRAFTRFWDGEPIRLVFCIRNPWAWLVSFYRLLLQYDFSPTVSCPHFKKSWGFPRFVRSPHQHWDNPIHRWNSMCRYYLACAEVVDAPTTFVRSEDMTDPRLQVATIKRIGRDLQLEPRGRKIRPILNRASFSSSVTPDRMNFDYFKKQQYLRCYTPRLLRWVNSQVDKDLLLEFGYLMPEM